MRHLALAGLAVLATYYALLARVSWAGGRTTQVLVYVLLSACLAFAALALRTGWEAGFGLGGAAVAFFSYFASGWSGGVPTLALLSLGVAFACAAWAGTERALAAVGVVGVLGLLAMAAKAYGGGADALTLARYAWGVTGYALLAASVLRWRFRGIPFRAARDA